MPDTAFSISLRCWVLSAISVDEFMTSMRATFCAIMAASIFPIEATIAEELCLIELIIFYFGYVVTSILNQEWRQQSRKVP